MASLNIGKDVANKRERKQTAAHIVTKSYPLYIAVKMCRYGSLINIDPSALHEVCFHFSKKQAKPIKFTRRVFLFFTLTIFWCTYLAGRADLLRVLFQN